MRDFDLGENLCLWALLIAGFVVLASPDVLLLALLVLRHLSHAAGLAALQVLSERLELRRLPLAVPVLKQALGLLLSEGLLVLQLHELFVAR